MKISIKILLTLLSVCLIICFTPSNVHAQKGSKAQKDDDTQFYGKLFGVKRIADQKTTEPKYELCSQDCVKNGQPMGLLTDDGTLVLIVRDNSKGFVYEKMKKMVGQKVAVMGKLAEKDGMKVLTVNQFKVQ